jgi:hypothetical protein
MELKGTSRTARYGYVSIVLRRSDGEKFKAIRDTLSAETGVRLTYSQTLDLLYKRAKINV